MKTSTVLLWSAVALSLASAAEAGLPFDQPATDLVTVIRGQTPTFQYEDPILGAPEPLAAPTTPEVYPNGGSFESLGTPAPQAAPFSYDPFNIEQAQPLPYGAPPGPTFGTVGPQPFRYGWTSRYDIAFLPRESVKQGFGEFEVLELNAQMKHTTPTASGWIFSVAPEFGRRGWEGPNPPPARPVDLPEAAYHFATDLELQTPANGPLSVQFGFTPQINSDLERHLTSDAWYFDGRGIVFYRVSPMLTLGVGAMYWDRLHDRWIPYGGIIYVPDDRREYRLMFPESRISHFIGTPLGIPAWAYVRGEYHVEAYEIDRETINDQGEVELIDWRVLIGLRTDSGGVGAFAEAGWVFGRHVNFNTTPGFDVSSGFIARAGVRF